MKKQNFLYKIAMLFVLAILAVFVMTGCDSWLGKSNDGQKTVPVDSTKVTDGNIGNYNRKNGQQIKTDLLNQWMFPENYSEKEFYVLDDDNNENFIDVWDLAKEFEYIQPQITRSQELYIRGWDRRIIGFDKNFPGYIYYRRAKGWEVESYEAMAECLEKINLQRDRDMFCYTKEDFFNEVMSKRYRDYLKNNRGGRLGRQKRS